MNEMFTPLSDEEKIKAEINKSKPADKVPIVPVPKDAPSIETYHHKYGKPQGVFPYIDADGNLHGYVLRWDYMEKGVKQKLVLPITYCELKNGSGWRKKRMGCILRGGYCLMMLPAPVKSML